MASALDERYAFNAEWFDTQAQLAREYIVFFYPSDASVEMFDVKNKRTFLKRNKYTVTLPEFYIGAQVNIFGRQLAIKSFADDFTRLKVEKKLERTAFFVKPESFAALGSILAALNKNHFHLCQIKSVNLTAQQSASLSSQLKSSLPSNGSSVIAVEVSRAGVLDGLISALAPQITAGSVVLPSNIDAGNNVITGVFGDVSNLAPASATGRPTRTPQDYSNCSLCVIKPHVQQSSQTGAVLQTLLDGGYKVVDIESFVLEKPNAEEFMEVYRGVVPEYHLLVDQLTAGTCIAIALAKPSSNDHVVAELREFVGPADVELAKVLRPKSVRAVYGTDRVKNVVHVTDLKDDGKLECEYFFNILAN